MVGHLRIDGFDSRNSPKICVRSESVAAIIYLTLAMGARWVNSGRGDG